MATDEVLEAFRGAILLCMELYGEDETRIIMKEVYRRVDESGLDGAFMRDWIIFTKQTAVARHPASAIIWNSVKGLEKSNALPTN